MSYEIRQANPPPIAVSRKPRPNGIKGVYRIGIHGTRGAHGRTVEESIAVQVQATENWFGDPDPFPQGNNHGTWGSAADFVIGPDVRIGGRIAIVQFKDWRTTWSQYAMGYGSSSTTQHPASQTQIDIELAQPPRLVNGRWQGGDSDVAYTDETIDALVWLCAELNAELVAGGALPIPAVRIPYWDQLLTKPIPRGFIGHEDTANGKKGGKSDPGQMFPWPEFIERYAHAIGPRGGDQVREHVRQAELANLEIVRLSAEVAEHLDAAAAS